MKKILFILSAIAVVFGVSSPALASGGSKAISPSSSCVFINDYKATSGYTPSTNSTMGAVWVQWKLNPCYSPSGLGIDIQVKLTDVKTSTVLYTLAGTFAQQTIDFDNLKTGNSYHVDYNIYDHGTGLLLESRSTDLSTPSHNQIGI